MKCNRCNEEGDTETINNEWLCYGCEANRTDKSEEQ